MIKNTDFLMDTSRIAVSYGAKYNPNLIARSLTETNLLIAHHAIPILRDTLTLPDKLWVRVAFLKAKHLQGRYWDHCATAEVDARCNPKFFLEVLCHELVHADQYTTGRLTWQRHGRKNVNYWHGSPVIVAYRDQPWEQEAFERQVTLATDVIKKSTIIHNLVSSTL